MKTTCRILVFGNDVSKECFGDLVKVYPDGHKYGTTFKIEVPAGHSLISKVVAVLQKYGLKMPPNDHLCGEKGYISIEFTRKFEGSDLNGAKYLEIRMNPEYYYVTKNKRAIGGKLIIEADSISKRHPMAGDMSCGIMVSDKVREVLLKQNFQRLQFRPCVIKGEGAEDFDDFPIWEVTSGLNLPYLSPLCKFYDDKGRAVSGKSEEICGLDDDLHVPTQLRYRVRDLKKAEPFDVALTREIFNGEDNPTALVVSQRFYQFCMRKKYKVFAVPVRIEPD